MADCLIGLGSNVGDRIAHLDDCVTRLCGHPQIHRVSVSRYRETTPIGGPQGQGPFLNAAVRVTTELAPDSLLAWTRCVEKALGRQRAERWGPRVIDIDILLYDQLIYESDTLVLPHPRMAVRRFVLQSASEIAGYMIHPPTGWPLARLLSRLDEPPCYVAIASASGSARTDLAAAASARVEALVLSSGARVESAIARPNNGSPRSNVPAEDVVQRELDSLSRHRQLLSTVRTSASAPSSLILSDFWLNQTLAVASIWPPGTHRARLEQACQRALAETPEPKFVLLLDTTAEGGPAHRTGDVPTARDCDLDTAITSLARALRRQAAKPGQAPILCVRDRQLALVELLAAIDAMR